MQPRNVPQASHLPLATAPPSGTPLAQPMVTRTVTSGINLTSGSSAVSTTRYSRLQQVPLGTKMPAGNFKITIPGSQPRQVTPVVTTQPVGISTTTGRPIIAGSSTMVGTSTTAGLLPTPTTVPPKLIIRVPHGSLSTPMVDRALLHKSLHWDATQGPRPNIVTTSAFRSLASQPRHMVSTVVTMGSTTVVTWSWQPRYNDPNSTWSNEPDGQQGTSSFRAVNISSQLPLCTSPNTILTDSLSTSATSISTTIASIPTTLISVPNTVAISSMSDSMFVPAGNTTEVPVVISDDEGSQSSYQSVRHLVQQVQEGDDMEVDTQFLDVVQDITGQEVPISGEELSDTPPPK